ncbi:Pkinase-domain-containing protein [Mollisia scopiformis]|uniref:non-specific serine/threonine protein kinase n=1 Tax=Mollisia scopiformis TaxID=149040 RepID=A0A194XUX1_MOLSC|nr:Pkinase-domain-containing protein [Mollisia scopiformis]KUJ23507.1 Pkinase-domain-containing protein [Mollisia scopiformis]
MSSASRQQTRRPALGEATGRVNNTQTSMAPPSKVAPSMPHHESRGANGQLGDNAAMPPPSRPNSTRKSSAAPPVSNRLSEIMKDDQATSSKRTSQASTSSANSRIKVCVGPWRLGRTLGYGATARVRLAKHIQTGQVAAVKIIAKKSALISQAGSLADLEKADLNNPEEDGIKRMPVGIEREVAIMKLIQHPNIMKLYDIWENRTEIYLVLEFLENGELFERISSQGRLQEVEAMKYFRQLISALGYCHSFNICHRDLKPENILVSAEGNVKIADFGMAALQQGPDFKLRTSCGSPHYAAPELVKGHLYRGNLVDIWSMGVILYAMLAGRLPFDGGMTDDIGTVLKMISKGRYTMSPDISPAAADLIKKMLQVNPKDRITIAQIWRHPLMQAYDHLDDLGKGLYPQSPSAKAYGHPVSRRSEIDKDIVRQLNSMWHTLSEQQLIESLLNEVPNDQKIFYALLSRHRDAQLEDYTPELEYSTSDYHHVRPPRLRKTYSTRHFSQVGHKRQGSKFTVISNSAETEKSYDPFKASRPQRLSSLGTTGPKVTIHRNDRLALRPSTHLAPPKFGQTRSSLASSVKSSTSGNYARAAGRYKRGVSFNHLRVSTSSLPSPASSKAHKPRRHSNHTEVTDDGGDTLRPVNKGSPSSRYIRSRKAQTSQNGSPAKKAVRASLIWGEDVRQLSSSLAKDCDEAFNRGSVMTSEETIIDLTVYHPERSSANRSNAIPLKSKPNALDTRPLPPPPARTESVKIELAQQKLQFELRKELEGPSAQGHLDRMVTHLDELMRSPSSVTGERRASSAPFETWQKSRQLPSIHETGGEDSPPRRKDQSSRYHRSDAKNSRIASAPEPRDMNRYQNDRFTKPDSSFRDTIRVVPPSSSESPVKMPAPLTIRKKSSQAPKPPLTDDTGSEWESCYSSYQPAESSLRQQYNMAGRGAVPSLTPITERHYDEETEINENASAPSNTGTVVRKRSGWFRRNSKASDDSRLSNLGSETQQSIKSGNGAKTALSDRGGSAYDKPQPPLPSPKKKGIFGKLFKKRSKADMQVANHDIFEDEASLRDSVANLNKSFAGRFAGNEDAGTRQIAPQRNWLAKLFHVKPAARYLCFSVSQRTARKEIVIVFRDWKKYGMRDIQVDKRRNVVFAKVGPKNYLDIKEVSIAAEVMTVIEHGKRSQLSIVRFTQEQGAASSFNKVLDTLENVLHVKKLLVLDELKSKRMIKTLTSS